MVILSKEKSKILLEKTMPKELTLEQTYDQCCINGNIILLDTIDLNRMR